jgi:hypothetical protein
LSGLEPPTTTIERPSPSTPSAGGAHDPDVVCDPGGSPKRSKLHARLQFGKASVGSTPCTAQMCPPSSVPVRPLSPKYAVRPCGPAPSGSTTSGEAAIAPPVKNVHCNAPVVAFRAYSL